MALTRNVSSTASTAIEGPSYKRKYITLFILQKTEIINRYNRGVKAKTLSEEYGVGVTT